MTRLDETGAHVVAVAARSVEALRDGLRGPAYLPSDAGYRRARRGSPGTTPVDNRHPALVVEPETAEDVARTIEFAHTQHLDLSVRSGGHDALAASTTHDGVLVDLGRMAGVRLDPRTGVATAGAGVRSGALVAVAADADRAAIVGMNPNVGLGGVTLGGGIGWLCGTHGATVDTLLAVEIVTVDGRRLNVDARHNAELFWALRGGGGNFGVATSFTYQLPPARPVTAGMIGYEVNATKFLTFVRDILADSPDALDIAAGVSFESAPRSYLRVCWSGDAALGERVLRPLRTFAPPIFDTIERQSYAGFSSTSPSTDNMAWRGGEFDGMTDDVIAAVASGVADPTPAGCTIWLLHYMHGALCRVPFAETPLIREAGHILFNVVASWANDSEQHHVSDAQSWVHATAAALNTVGSRGVYLNYLSDEKATSVPNTFGSHYPRLQAIKRQLDPDNFFHNNRNIVP